MTAAAEFVADARRVADAILYEGYLLYPYRGSARKNQSRFQFGVLMPPAYRDVNASEPSVSQTECLLEAPDDAGVTVIARFLHLQRRQVEVEDGAGGYRPVASVQVDDAEVITWDEAAEREHRATVSLAALLAGGVDSAFQVPGSESVETLTDGAGRCAGAGPAAGPADRGDPPAGGTAAGALRRAAAAADDREPDHPGRPAAAPGGRAAPRADRYARADLRARGQVPVADRSARMGGPVRRGVHQPGHLAGAGRPGGMPGAGAQLAGHPLRPPADRRRERGRPVRFDRDRRDPDPAHARADRRGKAGGPRHRPTRGRAAGPPGRPAAGDVRAHARRHPLSRPGRGDGHRPARDRCPGDGRARSVAAGRPPRRIVRCRGGIRGRTPASPRRATTS